MSIWILLRGLAREKRHWHGFPQVLRKEWPDARVIELELPGNGDLNGMTSPSNIAAMATRCRAEAAGLGLPPPYRLLALSMGAMVATAWAASHPEEVEACVLINTSFGAFNPIHQRFRPRAWWTLLRILLTPSERKREALIFRLTSQLASPPAPVIDEWVAIRRSRPVRPWNAIRQLLAAAKFRAPLEPPAKTLILASAGDRLVDPRCSIEIARHWGCDLAIHPAAGHDLPLDDGSWVVKEIHEWMDRAGSPGTEP